MAPCGHSFPFNRYLKASVWAFAILLLLQVPESLGKRGGRGKTSRKTGGGKQIFLPHKSMQPKTVAYYNHENASKIVNWSHFESEYILGRKIFFMCSAIGLPRPRITWYKDGIELFGHSFFQIHEWNIGEHKIKSKMEIDPATQMDAGYYECAADNKYAVDYKSFRTYYSIEFD